MLKISCKLIRNSQLPISNSQLPITDYRLPIPNSQFPIPAKLCNSVLSNSDRSGGVFPPL
ncbi:MAG: hypothetical protein EAZ90_23175 [Oscillatoriales cyanobacterium]|nr:MAG: hypothetical protein EAZ94_27925 [Oscillatoriales cyanobacterium]TAE19522.1 MAG: hypothetical protein EAZ93_26700 [Oscillatoriales cyanobacterium]TAE39423.1 MAG: hypothetical protein EAZ90_23175 [Oscillatoriales cyanobacterium]TAE54688.1 MAG: hypothetical protein EAZ88_08335 [Oscillatoriales cyanobacterium]TAE68268.1 MAG: hypothetical protein EAZ86_13825 [Oscillatoriales cyanobacterium]